MEDDGGRTGRGRGREEGGSPAKRAVREKLDFLQLSIRTTFRDHTSARIVEAPATVCRGHTLPNDVRAAELFLWYSGSCALWFPLGGNHGLFWQDSIR